MSAMETENGTTEAAISVTIDPARMAAIGPCRAAARRTHPRFPSPGRDPPIGRFRRLGTDCPGPPLRRPASRLMAHIPDGQVRLATSRCPRRGAGLLAGIERAPGLNTPVIGGSRDAPAMRISRVRGLSWHVGHLKRLGCWGCEILGGGATQIVVSNAQRVAPVFASDISSARVPACTILARVGSIPSCCVWKRSTRERRHRLASIAAVDHIHLWFIAIKILLIQSPAQGGRGEKSDFAVRCQRGQIGGPVDGRASSSWTGRLETRGVRRCLRRRRYTPRQPPGVDARAREGVMPPDSRVEARGEKGSNSAV